MFPELLTDTTSYFRQRVKYPTLRAQVIMVTLAGLAANAWRIALLVTLGAAATYVEAPLYITTAIGLIEVFVLWGLGTAVVHLVASSLGGDSSYGQLLRLTGYGFAPIVVGGAIWSAGWYLALQSVEPPAPPGDRRFVAAYVSLQNYLGQAAGDPVLLAGLAIGAVFVAVGGCFWYRAVRVVTGIGEGPAAIAAGLPLAAYVAWEFVQAI